MRGDLIIGKLEVQYKNSPITSLSPGQASSPSLRFFRVTWIPFWTIRIDAPKKKRNERRSNYVFSGCMTKPHTDLTLKGRTNLSEIWPAEIFKSPRRFEMDIFHYCFRKL